MPGAENSPEPMGEVWPQGQLAPFSLLLSLPLLYSHLLFGALLVPPPCFPPTSVVWSPFVSAPLTQHFLPWTFSVFWGTHILLALVCVPLEQWS